MAGKKKQKSRTAVQKPPKHQAEPKPKTAEEDHISKLPDEILVHILSLCRYRDAVRTASVSRRWEHLHTQLPLVDFVMSLLGNLTAGARATPSKERVQSMERTLRRRCPAGRHHTVKTLRLVYRKDVPMECRYADDFIALANAPRLQLHVKCKMGLPDEDAGPWSVELPPATTDLKLRPYWYAVRPPRIHGPGVSSLRSLTLDGLTVLRQDFLLTGFPSLEDLHIRWCALAASIEITSDSMPRLKHLSIVDVSVMTNETKAAISVLANELTTLRVSCHSFSEPDPMSVDPAAFVMPARFHASFTVYSSFRLRAPNLKVLDCRCFYADEVRVESVGRLSDVTIELAAGRMPRRSNEESKVMSMERCQMLMRDILRELMPGLQPRSWKDVERLCVQRELRDKKWVCFEITSAPKYLCY